MALPKPDTIEWPPDEITIYIDPDTVSTKFTFDLEKIVEKNKELKREVAKLERENQRLTGELEKARKQLARVLSVVSE